jgi:hypothetical protein
MEYWHLVKRAPKGSIAERAESLWRMVEKEAARKYQKWPIPQSTLRVMTIELAAAFAIAGQPMTPPMLKLLAWAMGVAPKSLRDPISIYSGHDGKGQAVESSRREQAEIFDAHHFREHGKLAPINTLAKAAGINRDTVRRWRAEPEYETHIHLICLLGTNSNQTLTRESIRAMISEGSRQGWLDLIKANHDSLASLFRTVKGQIPALTEIRRFRLTVEDHELKLRPLE